MSSTSTTWITDTNTKSGTVQIYSSNVSVLKVVGDEGGDAVLDLFADQGDDNADKWRLWVNASDDDLHFSNYTSGTAWTDILTLQDGGNVGIGDAAPACKLEVAGAIAGKIVSITASADDTDISEAYVLKVSTNGGTVVLGGLVGGVAGQVLHIIKVTLANDLTLENVESSGNQDFALITAADETVAGYGGWTLVCDGLDWYAVSSPTGAADSA